MKNKKGFSLIELVGVIVIIGLILIVAIPAVTRLLKSNNNKEYANYLKIVKTGALRYADELKDELGSSNNSGCIDIDLDDLIEEEYIEKFNDEKITCDGTIRLDNKKGNVRVYVNLTCTNNKGKETYKKEEIDESVCIAYTPGSGGNSSGGNNTSQINCSDGSNTLTCMILNDNTAISDEGLDFSVAPTTAGLYYTSTNTEGNQPTYYFRGDVQNNYVKFAPQTITTGACLYKGQPVSYGVGITIETKQECDSLGQNICLCGDEDEESSEYFSLAEGESCTCQYCYDDGEGGEYCEEGDGTTVGASWVKEEVEIYWRIVRINEDGSIKLVYLPSQYGDKSLSTSYYDELPDVGYANGKYLGYMYDNVTDSVVKTTLDAWYEENLINYSSYFADPGFCNDRGIFLAQDRQEINNGIYDTDYYLTYNRINNLKKPQFACPDVTNDLFTTSASTKGNKLLTYPIGLLTVDEIMYAGANSGGDYYLKTFNEFLTMSPAKFVVFEKYGILSNNTYIYVGGGSSLNTSYGSGQAAPVINLKMNAKIVLNGTGEPGTITNPYVIS